MGISREPTGINSLFLSRLAAVAVLAVGGGQYFKDPRHEANVSNSQRLRGIHGEITRHGGLCSDPEKGVVFVRNGVVAYLGPDSYNFSLGLGKTGEVIGSEGHGDAFDGVASLLPPREIPEFLSRAEAATRDICLNTPNPSPDNDTSPHRSNLLTWSFLGQGPQNG